MSHTNVLFIISDQHRWDYAGFAGHPTVKTPNLDRLAAEGVRFTQSCCQGPLCGPSRASVLTGTHTHTCRAWSHLKEPLPDMPTLGSVFRQAGYATGAIGKLHVVGETRQRDLGFDDRQMRIYTYWFEDYIRAVGEEAVDRYATYRKGLPRYQTSYNPTNTPIDIPEDKMYDHLVVDRCIGFLTQNRDKPFFLWAGIEKPHPDWTAPARYHRMYDPRKMALPATVAESRTDMPNAWYASTRQSWCFDEAEIRHCIAAYHANVTYMDAKIGELLGALDRLGLRDNTLVVYTTDHGEMLFEHGMVQKQNFFEGSVRVPLLVRQPGRIPAGVVRDDAASLIDLFPTFCEMTGVAAPEGLEGRSLVPELSGKAPVDPERAAFAEYYSWGFPERMIRTRDWKYIWSQGQTAQLYDLKNDPGETCNRIADPACAAVRESLHGRLMDGWEMPDAGVGLKGKPWNDISEARSRQLMTEWAATRRRIF